MNQVVVDLVNRSVQWRGVVIHFTPGEFSLLLYFLRKRGQTLSRDEIIEQIRGGDSPVTPRSVDVRIAGLRRKLSALGDPIETVRGSGYRFREDSSIDWPGFNDLAPK